MSKELDSRYDHTEADLLEAFQILARKKDPDKITVAEITRVAGVTRSTFYNHYVDMPTLVNAVEEQILDEIFQMMTDFHPEGSDEISRRFFETLCGYIQRNGFLAHMLASPHAAAFMEKARPMCHRDRRDTLAEGRYPDQAQGVYSNALAYSIGGVVGVLHQWALGGCAEPPQAVARSLSCLFLDGMRPVLAGLDPAVSLPRDSA